MYALLSLPVGLAVSLVGLYVVHWLPSGYSDDRKLPCCQKPPSTMGRIVSTVDPNKVTCRPWGYDLNKAWKRLADELEATKQ